MILTEANFLLFAAKFYDNPSCVDMEEFQKDLARFKYIKRLFTNYKESGLIKERLVLNHLIILYNLFGESATRMLYLKLSDQLEYLKPFLIAIDRIPEHSVLGPIDETTLDWTKIPCDMNIVNLLRKDLVT